ncbi:MAG: efflux RND transporter permease subunit [Phycisphaeraceae bacterium]|nr:MAG: efflux RND transporter permease subunit [Phycisphaeraceae bacterium]
MDIVRFVIKKPVTVAVGVILLVMFGLIGLGAIPIQLAPNVDRPIITVTTNWPGRSPEEIVDQITKEQEKLLKNVSNLRTMLSVSRQGASEITLEFFIEADIRRALQEVSDSLRQVPSYPQDVDEPVIKAAEGSAENAIAWIIIEVDPEHAHKHPDFDITTLYDALDKEVRPYLERVDGVAEINIFGGRQREARVLADPTALSRYNLTYQNLIEALQRENENISAGDIAEGKRDYRIRVLGRFETEEEVLNTVIVHRDGAPIFVRDVAEVEIGYEKLRGFVRSIAGQAIAINAIRQGGSNVMEIMEGLQARLDEVRERILPNIHPTVGPDLRMRQVYDETIYITSSIQLVTQNLWIGGALAALVLLLFLRSFVSTGVVALAIPISVIGTFLVLLALGRSLNVVSLAGLAFAVGLVVDNAIVVLENIYRRLQAGDPPMEAAYNGGREVWGAILASTLTTIAVFIPILTIQEEAGQLFRDIALAVVAAVALSLIVSITVIPAASSRWMSAQNQSSYGPIKKRWKSLFGLAPLLGRLVYNVGSAVKWLMTGWRGWTLRPAIIIAMTGMSLLGAYMLAPPLDYLPAGNRNLVFGGLLVPPGQSLDQLLSISGRLETQLAPYVAADPNDPESYGALPPIPRRGGGPEPPPPFDPVPLENFFIGVRGGGMFMGATSAKPQVVAPVGQLVTNAMNTIPDAFGGARQTSLFGRGAGGGNTINLEVSGPDLDAVTTAARRMFDLSGEKFGFQDVRPDPQNFNLTQPEWRLRLNNTGRELGMTTRDLGVASRALFDGAFVGDFSFNGDTIDLVVVPVGGRLDYKEQLATIPIVTPSGRVVPMDTIADIVPAQAPQEIQRIEELSSVTIRITPPSGEPLESVMREIRREIVEPVQAAGLIDRTMRIRLEGTAAKLDEVKRSLVGSRNPDAAAAPWQRAATGVSWLIMLAGAGVAVFGIVRAMRRRRAVFAYGAAGALLLAVVIGGLLLGLATTPELALARLVWALVVVYLLMAALFESFIYPFVIMFTVPLAIVGGFAGLKIVHEITMRNPILQPQQLDVLTMLGFIILIGVVVNNAILIVHQSLNFMRGTAATSSTRAGEEGETMPPTEAIAEAVRTRIRPIFMSTTTSVLGMLPLVLFPGAGSELYRGLGSVVIGGLIVATFFTIFLVPLFFSLVLEMSSGLRVLLGRDEAAPGDTPAPTAKKQSKKSRRKKAEQEPEPSLQPA